MTNPQISSPKEGLKQTQILHLAMTLGLILLFTAFTFIFGLELNPDTEKATVLGKVFPIFLVGLLVMGIFSYKSRVAQTGNLQTLLEKTEHYRTTSIIRWALIEGAALMSLVFHFVVESNYLFLGTFGSALLCMLFFRPSKNQFAQDYQLSNQEISELN